MSFGVFCIQHDIQEIVDFWLWIFDPLLNNFIAKFVHAIDVFPVFFVREISYISFDIRSNSSSSSFFQVICHLLSKYVHILTVEIVETMIEGTETDRIKC